MQRSLTLSGETENSAKSPLEQVSDWLKGGGEMGDRVRQTDWSRTPLGPANSWSPALRMIVKFLLANRFPQLLWWGPEFCSIYNDSYVPILGTKHPWALGRPVSEVWNEIWHVLKPLIETPFSGGPATWMEDIPLEINRSGFFEETHFTIAYSPVPDDSVPSGIGGVLATVHEITEKVVGERRVRALRDLGARSVEPKSVEEACNIIHETLSTHPKDIPFLLLYLLDEKRQIAKLACCIGADPGDPACPQSIDLSSAGERVWPLSSVQSNEDIQLVDELRTKFDRVPQGPWADAPNSAAVLPVRSNIQHQLAGFMIAGVSSRVRFDKRYRDFLELMSTQIATTIANARAYEEERKRAEALAEIDRAKTLFFSNVSHEFRTPLTLMLGPLEDTLASDKGLAEEQRNHIEVAHRNSLRLLKLVNSLLDFSRLESGRIQACYEPTELGGMTAELASLFRSAIERAGLRLLVNCPAPTELAYVDHEMWEKIVFNLLSNAVKFTFEGEIEIALTQNGNTVDLMVRDTGTGIPAQDLPRLFERFYRVQGARSRSWEGSGIGLALVQELAKLHGGSVRVESTPNRGSCFIVTIPLGKNHLPPDRIEAARTLVSTGVRAEAYVQEVLHWSSSLQDISDAVQVASLIPRVGPSPPDKKSQDASRILLADDNADMREYVRKLLDENYEVIACEDGRSALDCARQLRPDLVLADVMMPRLDGFGLLRSLREDESLRATPVILLSARAGEESRIEGLDAGADDYLVKPFSARELLARVGSHLAMAKVRREAAELERKLRFTAELERSRLQELFMQAPAVIGLLSGPEHRFTFVNRDYVRVTGRQNVDDFVGKTVREALPEIEGQGFLELLDEVYQTGKPYVGTAKKATLNRGPNGEPEEAYFDFVYQPMRDSSGRVEGILVHGVDVTEQVLARQEIESREWQFREMIDVLPAAIYTTDAKGRLTHFNPAAVRFSGRTPELGIDQWCVCWKLYYPDGRPMRHDECPMAIALKQGHVIEGAEAIAERPDGSRRWFMPFPTPIRDNQGTIIGGINMLVDITERKEAERATSLLAAIVDSSDDAIFSKTLDGRITSWNKGAERLFGYKSEEAVGQRITLIVPWERRTEEEEILRRLARGERVDHFETLRKRKDGGTFDVSLTISPLRDSTGCVVGASNVARDITERKRTERELRESEERFRAIVETTPECVKLVAADSTLLHINPPGLQMVGARSADEVIGKSVYDLIAPEDRESFKHFNERICRGEKGSLQFDIIGVHGQRRSMETHAAPLSRPDGSMVHLAVTRDISERKQAEQALRRHARWLAGQKEAFQAAVNGAPLEVSLGMLIKTAIQQTDGEARCAFYIVDVSGTALHHVAGMPDDYAKWVDGFEIGPESLACGLAVHTGQSVITPDVTKEPRWQPWLWLAEKYEYRGCWSFPVETSAGNIVGTFAMYFKEPREATTRDREFAALLAQAAGIIISRHDEAQERARAESVLRESEERLRLATEAAKIGAFDWNIQTGVNTWSAELEAMYGLAPGQFGDTQQAWEQLVHPDDRAATIAKVEEALATSEPVEPEWRVVWPDGSVHWILGRFQCFKDGAGKPLRLTGVNIDITPRKEAEEKYHKLVETLDAEVRARTRELEQRNAEVLRQSEQVRELSWRLLRAQDEERRHIARELHDSAGQTLTVLGMNLAQLVQKAGRTAPELAAEAEMTQEMVQQLHRDIRTTSYLLHPPLLDENGLYSALSWYMQGLVERSELKISLDISQEFGRLPRDMELAVFRLVQECLTNIHRHSGSKTAVIRIARDTNQVTVHIQDAGRGMSPQRLAEIQSGGSGVGIRGMRERLRQFEAQMKIESDNSGTRIFVTIPVPSVAKSEDEPNTEPLQAIS
jgi:PAS domain S-box-containing protein